MTIVITRRLLLIFGLGLAIILVFGWQLNTYLARERANAAAYELVKKTVAQSTSSAENMISLNSEKNDQTYAEYFGTSEAFLKSQQSAIVLVDTSDIDQKTKEAAKDYLNGITDLVRLNTGRYRKGLAASNASDIFKNTVTDFAATPYNEYSYDWEVRRVNNARNNALESSSDLKHANQTYVDGLNVFRTKLKQLNSSLKDFHILTDNFMSDLISKTGARNVP